VDRLGPEPGCSVAISHSCPAHGGRPDPPKCRQSDSSRDSRDSRDSPDEPGSPGGSSQTTDSPGHWEKGLVQDPPGGQDHGHIPGGGAGGTPPSSRPGPG